MEKHAGLLESIQDYLIDNPGLHFAMPAHSGRESHPRVNSLLAKYGVDRVEGSKGVTRDMASDLGPLFHKAFGSQLSLLLQSGSTAGNHIVSYCLAGKKVLVQSNSHISLHVGLQLAGAKIVYVQPHYDAEYDVLLPITPP